MQDIMHMHYQEVLVTVTPQDIGSDGACPRDHPLKSALQRALGSQHPIHVSLDGQLAFEMETPYRTAVLPAEATQWLEQYQQGQRSEGFTFEILLLT